MNLCTYFVADSEGDESIFLQAGSMHSSSSNEFQEIYYRCVVTFFTSLRVFSENQNLYFFSNHIPDRLSDGFKFRDYLVSIGVKVIELEFTKRLPIKQAHFGNVFYVLDVLEYCRDNSISPIIACDNDCLALSDISELTNSLLENTILAYGMPLRGDKELNGLTQADCKDIVSTVFSKARDQELKFYGGEFYAFGSNALNKVVDCFLPLFAKNREFCRKGERYFKTEEQLLSSVFHCIDLQVNDVSGVVQRLYNSSLGNSEMVSKVKLAHLLQKKNTGLKKLYQFIKDGIMSINSTPEDWDDCLYRHIIPEAQELPLIKINHKDLGPESLVSVSSIYQNMDPNCCLDENWTLTNFLHTNDEVEPWALFDLQNVCFIDSVHLVDRIGFAERSNSLIIEISSDATNWEVVFNRKDQAIENDGRVKVYSAKLDTEARFVRVRLAARGCLNFHKIVIDAVQKTH